MKPEQSAALAYAALTKTCDRLIASPIKIKLKIRILKKLWDIRSNLAISRAEAGVYFL